MLPVSLCIAVLSYLIQRILGQVRPASLIGFIRATKECTLTCTMGKHNDRKAVGDNTGKVYGVQGLRVVDTSIFPLLPPGHLTSFVCAIAEKVAEDIKMGR